MSSPSKYEDIVSAIRDASDLSEELWNDPECQSEVALLACGLTDSDMLETLAIHEAGHEIYYIRAGCEILGFGSPRIAYDEMKRNPFQRQAARTIQGPNFEKQGEDWFEKLARGYAAAGRCSALLSKLGFAGDSSDRENFEAIYLHCFPNCKAGDAVIEKVWLRAQDEVLNDLESDSFQKEIKERGRQILPELFPWLRDPHTPV